MNLRNIISNLLIVTALALVAACSKTAVTPPLEFQKQLLAGTGSFQNTQHIWQLDSTKINGVNSILTNVQKNYKKTFTFDGGYSDSDNNTGKWEIPALNKLKQTFLYQLTNKQDSTTYDIVFINSVQMSLSLKLANGQTAIYSFKISN
jgi:hypothetical protein